MINNLIHRQWQLEWSTTSCRMQTLKPMLGDWKSAYRESRKEEKIISRLRTGACKFLFQHNYDPNKDRDFCNNCNINTIIKHILVECPQFSQSRQKIIQHLNKNKSNLDEKSILDDKFDHQLLFEFLKNINYYQNI